MRNTLFVALLACCFVTGCTTVVEKHSAITTATSTTHFSTKHASGAAAGSVIGGLFDRASENARSDLVPRLPTLPQVATREYWNTKQRVPPDYGAYAYLVFTSDPRATQKKRYMEMCAAFNGYLPPNAPSASVAERRSQMVTFWPLHDDPVENPDCHQLIANYDRSFAARIAASIGKQDVRGPLLVAWTKPYGETSAKALVLDMSNFADDDLARAIRIWKGRIAMNPAIWQHGWKAVVVKEEIRSVIENIAPDVVTVVATFFRKSKPD